MAIVGLIGGSLLTVAFFCVLFDVFGAGSSLQGLFTHPEFVWELFLGIYLTVKGFKPSPIITSGETRHLGMD
jgi:hypothetical protein